MPPDQPVPEPSEDLPAEDVGAPPRPVIDTDREPRGALWLLLAPIIVLSIAATLADWFAAAVITDRPLLQIFLNPRIRYLALSANNVDPLPWFLVGFFRLVLTDPLYFLLGRWYGDNALRWIQRNWGGESAATVQTMERWFAKASHVVVLIAPNGIVCLLAGATRMRVGVFAALNVIGTIGRLILVWFLAQSAEEPLEDILGFIDRYQWWLVGISIALGLLLIMQRKRPVEGDDSAADAGAGATDRGPKQPGE